MRIIQVSGIRSTKNPVWTRVDSSFRREFPGVEMVVEEERHCEVWHVSRLRRFTKSLVQKYDDGTPTLFIGHSLGGVIACAAASRFKRSRVEGIVSIFSPHRTLGRILPLMLGSPKRPVAPLVSFQARHDKLVRWGSRHAKSIEHTVLDCDHFYDFVARAEYADRVAEITKRLIFSKPELR